MSNCEGNIWAFWSYDLPPYFLSGKVTKINKSGSVCVLGYGNHAFIPKVILVGDRGKKAHEKLRELSARWQFEVDQLRTDIKIEARCALGLN